MCCLHSGRIENYGISVSSSLYYVESSQQSLWESIHTCQTETQNSKVRLDDIMFCGVIARSTTQLNAYSHSWK